MSPILSQPVGIIGTGVAALINAHVLLQDGFKNVTLISKDESVGGVWARERVYPGLHINNVHGEYRFSALEMHPAFSKTGRLTGLDLCDYMETFAKKFLKDKAKILLRTEALDIRRSTSPDESGTTWLVQVKDIQTSDVRTLQFSRIILATGGCSNPSIPQELSPAAANDASFKGLVFHTTEFQSKLDEVLSLVKPSVKDDPTQEQGCVVVVGGGKSAQDICAKLASEGRKVAIVFDQTDGFLASVKPLPEWKRKGRFLSTLMAHGTLRTRWERFLHQTWLGSKLVNFLVNDLVESSYKAYNIPVDSPLRHCHPFFYSIRLNDESGFRPDSYHALVEAKAIDVVAPARVIGFSKDGKGVVLNDGRTLPASVVVLATGYKTSWTMFTDEVAEEIDIAPYLPTTKNHTWEYETLKDAPKPLPGCDDKITALYRGIIPAKNIMNRDFAIAGALFTTNPGYTNEVAAHWISSYFQGDKMRLPDTVGEAVAISERASAWMKFRFPQMGSWSNASRSSSMDFWTWPQAADELLEDMYLPGERSGGNWLTWIFQTINIKEIEHLGEERQELRAKQSSP